MPRQVSSPETKPAIFCLGKSNSSFCPERFQYYTEPKLLSNSFITCVPEWATPNSHTKEREGTKGAGKENGGEGKRGGIKGEVLREGVLGEKV